MKKFLIFKKLEDGSYGDKMGSYESEFKDDSSARRSYLMAEPMASHFELPEGMDEDCVELVLIPEVAYQAEKWVKGEEEVSLDPMDESWTYIPAVSAVVAHYELQLSPAKVLAKRHKKAEENLESIRSLREPLLKDADIAIFKLEDDLLDSSLMRTYRKSLRECTNDLKEEDGSAKLSCENLIPSEFIFPVKP